MVTAEIIRCVCVSAEKRETAFFAVLPFFYAILFYFMQASSVRPHPHRG